MRPPNNVSVPQWVRETGIPRDTRYGWRRRAAGRGRLGTTSAAPLGTFDSEEQFAVVMATAPLNERELGEYCRRQGLFPEQIAAWRETCRQANAPLATQAERAERRAERAPRQQLRSELRRQDRALAETAALLVLPKKVRALWEDPEDARSPSNSASR